jgi:parallel beta-helix repeat protein
VRNNGFDSGSTPSTERLGMVGYLYTGTNVVFSRNRVLNNAGPGLVMLNASGTVISQNSFSSNGGATAVSGLAIDLDPNTRDPNALNTPNGVTINDANDADTGPNGLLNFPVITSAIIANGELSITGFARPGSSIELYLAQADPSGFGEGLTYLTTLTEGAASDLNATAGSYGPAAINGLLQGTDTTNRFAFRMAIPSGVSIGSVLTSTGTLGGQTSELGGNVTVTSGPNLTYLKSVAVFSDPLNNTTNPKSIPGAMQVYTLRVTNQGTGSVDSNTVALVDAIPANTALFVQDLGVAGSGPCCRRPGVFQQRRHELGLHAGGECQWLRSGRDPYESEAERDDGGRDRRGQSVFRAQVQSSGELKSDSRSGSVGRPLQRS